MAPDNNHNSSTPVNLFRQSSPYIHAHRGKTFVLMLVGAAQADANFANIIHDIALLNSLGVRLVVVYGARPQIDEKCRQQHIEPLYIDDQRITDKPILELAKDALGNLRFEIEARLSMGITNSPMHGSRIRVVSGNFVTAKPLGVIDGVDFQHTGEVRRIDHEAIQSQLNQGNLVLLASMGSSPTGELFNLEVEEVATRTAIALKAEKLIALSSQPGIFNQDGQQLRQLNPREARRLLELQSSAEARRLLKATVTAGISGVRRSHIISYTTDGAILTELFTRDGVGTMVTEDDYDQIREACIDDVGGILELIQPLEEQGILVRRSRKQLEREISTFSLAERDGMIIGCASLNIFADGYSAELSCVAIHPSYRQGNRGDLLLSHIENRARQQRIKQLFVLTTQTAHWFCERGFQATEVAALPEEKQQVYNLQRNSKVFIKYL